MRSSFKNISSNIFDLEDDIIPFSFNFRAEDDWADAINFLSAQSAIDEILVADDSDMRPADPNDPVNLQANLATSDILLADDSDMRPADPNAPANNFDGSLATDIPFAADDSDMRPADPNDPVNLEYELATSDIMPADIDYPIMMIEPPLFLVSELGFFF